MRLKGHFMGPQPMPAQGAPAAPAEAAPKGGSPSQILSDSFSGLGKLMSLIQAKPDAMPPAFGEHVGNAINELKAAVESLSGAQPQGQATSTPEQGANPNAKPAL